MKPLKSTKKWLKANQEAFSFTAKVFVIWQLAIVLLVPLVKKLLTPNPQFLYVSKFKNFAWLWSRANFDGIHYLDIARKGYGIYQQAFFPLYPRLIKILTPFFGNQGLLAGLAVSWFFLFLALFVFYKLLRLDWKKKTTQRAIIYLLIFPTAFFFSMVYTESLFLFLVLASFYAARRQRWWWAGLFGALASATKLVGIFLWPALMMELWSQLEKEDKKNWRLIIFRAIPLLLVPLGLLSYMNYLQTYFQDALMFFHVQPHFGAERTGGKLILLYQVFWRYLKMLFTVEMRSVTYIIVVLEFLTGIGFLLLTIFTYLRRWFSYAVFMFLAYFAPTLTGTLSSVPRYVLILFPGFILLSIWAEKYRWVKILYPLIAIPLLIISLLFFTQGYWVA